MIPAFPKTYVVSVEPDSSEGFVKEPIVAWAPDPKEPMAHPIPLTMHGQRRMIDGAAILFPCGMVSDPNGDIAFESIEEWMNSAPGTRKLPEGAAAKPTKTKKPEEPEEGESVYDIEWTEGVFKSNSWWHYDDGEYEFLFQIDGGEALPKATAKCSKIKRDDFQSMKKTIDVLTVAEIMDAEPFPAPEDEDEDDADDLI